LFPAVISPRSEPRGIHQVTLCPARVPHAAVWSPERPNDTVKLTELLLPNGVEREAIAFLNMVVVLLERWRP
jgi:hypothetical protein